MEWVIVGAMVVGALVGVTKALEGLRLKYECPYCTKTISVQGLSRRRLARVEMDAHMLRRHGMVPPRRARWVAR